MSTATLTNTDEWLLSNSQSVHYVCLYCYPDPSCASVAMCGTPRPPGSTDADLSCLVCEEMGDQPCPKCGGGGDDV